MVLGGVQVDGMDAAAVLEAECEDVVTSRTNGKDDIILVRLQKAHISHVVFPSECIDVGVVEAGVLGKRRVVVDAPVVVLVPCSW